ncbi:MAG: VOC family protein [Clostridiales bacterium]|nr:VOC family protein [Clostridiales bacterium]
MIKELNHIGLVTSTMDESKRFYKDILGGTIIRDSKNEDGLSQFVYIQIGLGVIELIRASPGARAQGFVHIAYLISHDITLDKVYDYLLAKGYGFTVRPKSTASGDGRLAFFKDSSNVIFELIERREDIRIRDLTNPHITAFKHIGIHTTSEIALKCDRFYTGDMGFMKIIGKDAEDERRHLYKLADDHIQITEILDKKAITRPLHGINLEVESCDKMRTYLIENSVYCTHIYKNSIDECYFYINGPSSEHIVFSEK